QPVPVPAGGGRGLYRQVSGLPEGTGGAWPGTHSAEGLPQNGGLSGLSVSGGRPGAIAEQGRPPGVSPGDGLSALEGRAGLPAAAGGPAVSGGGVSPRDRGLSGLSSGG